MASTLECQPQIRARLRFDPNRRYALSAGILQRDFIAALALHDVCTSGRLHPATIWSGGFLEVCGSVENVVVVRARASRDRAVTS